jgi:hypothetical protein
MKKSGLFPCVDPGKRRLIFMKAKDLDKYFDSGGDVTEFLDISKAKRPGQQQKRVNVDFPIWMIHNT